MKGICFKHLIYACILLACLSGTAHATAKTRNTNNMLFRPFFGLEYQYEHIKGRGAYHLLLPANFQFGNVFVGTKIHKNFGLELGYFHTLNTSQNQFQFYDWGGSEVSGLTAAIARTSFHGFSLDANLYYALDPFFNVFAVFGVAAMTEDLTASATGSTDLAPALSLISGKTNAVPRLGAGCEYIERHWGMRGRIMWVYTQNMKIDVAAAQQIYPPLYDKPYLQSVLATVGIFYIF